MVAPTTPTQQQLEEVVNNVQAGLAMADHQAQVKVNEWIQQNARDPLFNSCLAVVATSPGQVPDNVRLQVAFTLKNNCVRFYRSAIAPCAALVQQRMLTGLADGCDPLRRAVASCVSRMAENGLAHWPTLVPELLAQLQASSAASHRSGILACLRDVCEDCAGELDEPLAGHPAALAEALVPALVQLLATVPNVTEMGFVLDALLYLMEDECTESETSCINRKCEEHVAPLYQGLMRAVEICKQGGDVGNRVRCTALGCLRILLYYYEKLKQLGVLGQLLQMIYQATNETDPDVALAACEFWAELTEVDMAVEDIKAQGLLHQLVDQLLNKMVYTDLEVAMIEAEEKMEQLNPPSHRNRKRHKHIEDEDDDDEDEGGASEVEQHTVRKCAAQALDQLSVNLGDDVVSPPGQVPMWLFSAQVEPRLQSADWKVQEATVLAIGAIAPGCDRGISPLKQKLVDMMLAVIADQSDTYHWLVKAIAFWTLSRLDQWVIEQHEAKNPADYYSKYLTLIMAGMKHPKRKVQENAVSAFAELVCHSEDHVHDDRILSMIIPHLAPCLVPNAYTARNMVILLDAIQTLTNTAGSKIATAQGHQQIFSPLINQLLPGTPDESIMMPNLLNAICVIARSLKKEFTPYVSQCFLRSLNFIGIYFRDCYKFMEAPDTTLPPDEENFIMSFDLVGALVVAMDEDPAALAQLEELFLQTKFTGTDYNLFHFSALPLTEPDLACDDRVVTAAISFFGENMRYFRSTLPAAVQMLPRLLENCESDDAFTNDICWFLGEFAVVTRSHISDEQQRTQMAAQMASKMVNILLKEREYHDNLLQNCAVAVGRVGHAAPALMAAQLPQFVKPLLRHLAEVPDGDEKESGFLGVVQMLQVNFGAVQDREVLKHLLKAMASFDERSAEMDDACSKLTAALQEAIPDWARVVQQLHPPTPPPPLGMGRGRGRGDAGAGRGRGQG